MKKILTIERLTIFIIFIVIFSRARILQNEDMGIFLTVSSFVSNGYKLYTEVFDIKDPYFFYFNAILFKIFGIYGFVISDILFILVSLYFYKKILESLGFSSKYSSVAVILVSIILTGSYYQTTRTILPAIGILTMSVYFTLMNRLFTAGFLFILMIGFKFTFVLFLPSFVVIIFLLLGQLNLAKFFIGLLFGSSLLLFALLARGELIGYVEMMKYNFLYAREWQKIIGFQEGLSGHINLFKSYTGYSLSFYSFIVFIIIFIYFYSSKERTNSFKNYNIWLTTIFVVTPILFYLIFTLLWPHHLHILSILFSFLLILLMAEIRNSNKRNFSFSPKNILFIAQISFFVLFSTISGLSFININPFSNNLIKSYKNITRPPEVVLLDKYGNSNSAIKSVTRLGMNDDLGYGAFFDYNRYKFKCGRTFIIGFESSSDIKRFVNCVKNEVDAVTIGPMYRGVVRMAGTYPDYVREMDLILENMFDCDYEQFNSYAFCKKLNLTKIVR